MARRSTDQPFFDPRPLPSAFPFIEIALPPDLRRALEAHCDASGDRPADVIADAVSLYLDERAGPVADAEIERAFSTVPWSPPPEPNPVPQQPPAPPPTGFGGER